MFAKKPWRILSLSRRMAELHAQMHAAAAEPDLPSQRERLREKISTAQALPADLRANALTALDSLPDGDRLCHGDFHPMNILVTREGETIIDWVDTTRGNPVADLARTSIILIGDADGKQGRSALERRLIRLIHGAYIQKYFQLQPGSRAECRRWLPVVAAARLSENILEVEDLLLAQAPFDVEQPALGPAMAITAMIATLRQSTIRRYTSRDLPRLLIIMQWPEGDAKVLNPCYATSS